MEEVNEGKLPVLTKKRRNSLKKIKSRICRHNITKLFALSSLYMNSRHLSQEELFSQIKS